MNTDKATPELFAALAKAQAEVENASKSSSNPHFKSMYADLAEVLNTVRPVFAKHGICIMQSTEFDGARVSVTTALAHVGGGVVASTASCVPAKTDAQGIGAATTYLRRYGLAAMAGVAQEDDDGQSAAHSGKPVPIRANPMDGVQVTHSHEKHAVIVQEHAEAEDYAGAWEYINRQGWNADDKAAVWSLLPSNVRSALKKAHKEAA
jgi:hypothetical protein